MDTLQSIWFLLIGVLLTGYAILDGFDLGVGVLHLFTREEERRRISLNAIGPVWDGNEVWLLTGGGALFAAFPVVYATVFSGFYHALMLLLVALILRAVALEFRSKVESPSWRRLWDFLFGIGSLLPAVLLGVAYGNILRGIPIDGNGDFTGNFIGLLNSYALLIGVLSLLVFIMHGALYLSLKTEGEFRERNARIAQRFWVGVVVLFLIDTAATLFTAPYLFENMLANPLFWVLLLLLLGAILMVPVCIKARKMGRAFLASSVLIAAMFGLSALSLFPRLAPSLTNLDYSLTIHNASSSETTLTVMLAIALVGMPLVIGYSIFIHRVFRGRVILNDDSY